MTLWLGGDVVGARLALHARVPRIAVIHVDLVDVCILVLIQRAPGIHFGCTHGRVWVVGVSQGSRVKSIQFRHRFHFLLKVVLEMLPHEVLILYNFHVEVCFVEDQLAHIDLWL